MSKTFSKLLIRIINRLLRFNFFKRFYMKHLVIYFPNYEPEVYLLRNKRFRISLDVGANVGQYTGLLSNISKEVWSFEPVEYCLRELFSLKYENLNVVPCALGESSGSVEMFIPKKNGNFLYALSSISSNSLDLTSSEKTLIEIKTLDSFENRINFKEIDFVKIDVEGFELSVLKGMRRVLENAKPVFLIEIEVRHNRDYHKVFEYLRSFDYYPYYTSDGLSIKPFSDINQILEFQSIDNFNRDVKSERKFRPGEIKYYLNNFIFIKADDQCFRF